MALWEIGFWRLRSSPRHALHQFACMGLKPFVPVRDTRTICADSDMSYIQAHCLLNFLACIAFSMDRRFCSVSMKFTCMACTNHKHLREHMMEAADRKVARCRGVVKCDAEIPKLGGAWSIILYSVVWDRLVSLNLKSELSHWTWANKSWPLAAIFLLELCGLCTMLSAALRVRIGCSYTEGLVKGGTGTSRTFLDNSQVWCQGLKPHLQY